MLKTRTKMIARYANLARYENVFGSIKGLRVSEFDQLLDDMLPRLGDHDQQRLARSDRKRAEGGRRHALLAHTNNLLLTVIWLRQYQDCTTGASCKMLVTRTVHARTKPQLIVT